MPKLGDIVILKSGSPRMTVSEIHESDGMLVCVYYALGKIDTVWVHNEAVIDLSPANASLEVKLKS